MKQYDKIFVPITHKEALLDCEARTIGVNYYKPEKLMFVLSVEEVSNLWNAGYNACMSDHKMTQKDHPDFETYLQSKGITLTPNT